MQFELNTDINSIWAIRLLACTGMLEAVNGEVRLVNVRFKHASDNTSLTTAAVAWHEELC
jgi:hypothetical protein